MFKKYALIGILGLMAALAISAFNSVRYQPVRSYAFIVAEPDFRTAHMWNGFYIPSMDVTGLLADPIANSALDPSFINFRTAHMWNGFYIPSMEVTANLADPLAISVPDSSYTNFRVAHMWNNKYIPSMEMTGLMTAHKWNSGH